MLRTFADNQVVDSVQRRRPDSYSVLGGRDPVWTRPVTVRGALRCATPNDREGPLPRLNTKSVLVLFQPMSNEINPHVTVGGGTLLVEVSPHPSNLILKNDPGSFPLPLGSHIHRLPTTGAGTECRPE